MRPSFWSTVTSLRAWVMATELAVSLHQLKKSLNARVWNTLKRAIVGSHYYWTNSCSLKRATSWPQICSAPFSTTGRIGDHSLPSAPSPQHLHITIPLGYGPLWTHSSTSPPLHDASLHYITAFPSHPSHSHPSYDYSPFRIFSRHTWPRMSIDPAASPSDKWPFPSPSPPSVPSSTGPTPP